MRVILAIGIFAIGIFGLGMLSSCASCSDSHNGNARINSNANANSSSSGGPALFETPPPEPVPSSTVEPNFKACNPYYPLIPGSQARYSLVYGTGLQASPVVVVDQTTENGVPVWVQRTQIVDNAGGVHKSELSVQKYVCDNGRIKVIAENSDNNVDGHKTTMEMHYVDPAYVMLDAAALKPGVTWSYSFTQTFRGPEIGITNSDHTNTFSCEVQGEEEVTVPAGKFKALKVNKKIGKADISEYFVRGLGMVKRRNGDGTTWDLLSYSGLRPSV